MLTDFEGEPQQEWLVTDGRGAFGMGTREGLRDRKYHGFYMGIPGRSETAFLTDFEMTVGGRSLWPHRYQAESGPLTTPVSAQYRPGPEWHWELEAGILRFAVRAQRGRGIELRWSWEAGEGASLEVEIRPFCAMRPLHGMGGESWVLEPMEGSAQVIRIEREQEGLRVPLYGALSGDWTWKKHPEWYFNFLYLEELRRGYEAVENLFSAGTWTLSLDDGETASILLSSDLETLQAPAPLRRPAAREVRLASLDFVLQEPAGIVAGYPWFGEWGRDTFIALPGLATSWIASGEDPRKVVDWAVEILSRWGEWIRLTGMLPNLMEKNGTHQWDSADATLWWCHCLASLWSLSLAGRKEWAGIESRFRLLLNQAVESIQSRRHLFLSVARDGALEVTEPYVTWMDARIDGRAVTPRMGRLPDVNALWFQARCLQTLWSGEDADGSVLKGLGRNILDDQEKNRPNFIFLHSLPLAPSFVLGEKAALLRDLARAQDLWTPVGLRTLSPESPGYRARCVGTQRERDGAYHQGTVWAWLGGHYEMAKDRAGESWMESEEMLAPRVLEKMPIEGHIPEIFDAQAPFTPRGAPAQAWSLACLEEAKNRRKLRVDAKLTEVLARRWSARDRRRKVSP